MHAIYTKIAGAVGVATADVTAMAARLSGADLSTNAPVSDSDGNSAERGDFMPDSGPLPDEIVAGHIDTARRTSWLYSAMTTLNPREIEIIQERHLRDDPVTLESLGVVLGISKERVRQLEARAMEKLKSALLQRQPHAASVMF